MKVIECFKISGRGTVVMLDDFTGLPSRGTPLRVIVHQGNGRVARFDAHKEWALKSAGIEVEAFVLTGAEVADVPIGSTVEISVKDS